MLHVISRTMLKMDYFSLTIPSVDSCEKQMMTLLVFAEQCGKRHAIAYFYIHAIIWPMSLLDKVTSVSEINCS